MSKFIDKLFGHDDEKKTTAAVRQETHQATGTTSTHAATSSTQNAAMGAAHQRDGVNVRSTVTSDSSSSISLANQQRLTDLVTQLGSTHSQIDEYARQQEAKIDAEIQREIDQVVAGIRGRQDELVRRATERTAQIDHDYRTRLQQMVEQVDAEKAKNIADIENELNRTQAEILGKAKTDIDALNKKAANLKIGVLQDAQARAASSATALAAEASHLGQASTIHQSSGTTVIKTETSASASTAVGGQTKVTAAQATSPTSVSAKSVETASFEAQQKK